MRYFCIDCKLYFNNDIEVHEHLEKKHIDVLIDELAKFKKQATINIFKEYIQRRR
jgi:hypothetical protein